MLRLAVATRAETFERMQAPLSERGIEVTHLETSSRAISIPASGDEDGTPEMGAVSPFDTACDVGFVFPSRMAEGGVADALLDVPWVNGREEVLRSRHKGEALARLGNADVPVPETVVISNPTNEATLAEVFESFEPPVVVKPNATTRGTGVAKAHDLDSFLGICDYLDLVHDYRATGDRSFLVQEYLPDARDYRAMVVDGQYVGAVERRLPDGKRQKGQWKHNVHRGARATGIELPERLQDLSERVARTLDIPYLGVDLLASEDRVLVNETNARPTIDDATKYEDGFWDRLADLVERTANQ